MLKNNPNIHPETIFVFFDKFSESSLDVFLYFFTNTTIWGEYLAIKEQVNFDIMSIINEEGVSLAYPSHSIWLEGLANESELNK